MYFYADYVFLQTVSHLFQWLEDELWELLQWQSDEMDYVISGSSRRVHPTIYYSCRKWEFQENHIDTSQILR